MKENDTKSDPPKTSGPSSPEELRRERDLLRRYMDTVETVIVALDEHGVITSINKKGCRLLGYTEEELIGKSWFETCLPQPDGLEKVYPVFSELMAGRIESVEYFENPVVTKTGDIRYIAWHNTLLYNDEGRIVGTLSSGNDVTERNKTEQALRETVNLLTQAEQIGRTGSWSADMAENLTVSPQMRKIMGFAEHEAVTGEKIRRRTHPDDRETVLRKLQEAYEKGSSDLEHRIILPDGTTRHIFTNMIAAYDPQGIPVSLYGVIQDITERKKAQEERLKLEEQLRQSQKLEAVGRLAGGVAHDFNNMLAVIIGHAELALDHIDPHTPAYADLQTIRKATERSATLVRHLLAFACKQTVAPKVIDLNETVQSMFDDLKRLIGEDIDLAVEPQEHLWQIRIDPGQVDQVLANLCTNARDAISGRGRITLATRNIACDETLRHENVPSGEYVLLSVSDNGCGMDAAMLGKIFEPFFTTKEVGEGSGLGLSTVYGIISQNNGFIHVESAPGRGTTFKIYLPRHPGRREETRTAKAVAETGPKTILLVEDEPPLLKMTETMLRRLGYVVLPAPTPEEAVRLATGYEGDIHLLITDVIMPAINGRDLAERIRALRPGLRCLFMSGYTADVIAGQGVVNEGAHFIQKPFAKNELADKVRHALESC